MASLACEDSTRPAPDPVKKVDVAGPDSVEVGARGTLMLTLRDSTGAALALPPNATWSVSDTAVARLLDIAGWTSTLQGRTTGTVVVTAQAYGLTATRTVRVVPQSAIVSSVRLTFGGVAGDSLEVGERGFVLADIRGPSGALLNPGDNSAGRVTVAWAVSDTTVARLSPAPNGGPFPDIVALAPGIVTVTARTNGVVSAPLTVRVVAVPVNGLPPASPAVSVATGGTHACSLTRTAQVVCWGNPRSGRLGRGP